MLLFSASTKVLSWPCDGSCSFIIFTNFNVVILLVKVYMANGGDYVCNQRFYCFVSQSLQGEWQFSNQRHQGGAKPIYKRSTKLKELSYKTKHLQCQLQHLCPHVNFHYTKGARFQPTFHNYKK